MTGQTTDGPATRPRPEDVRAADRRPGRELPGRAAGDRPRERRRPGDLAAAARGQPGAARRRPARRPARLHAASRSTSPTSAPTPTSTRCGSGWPGLLDSVDTYSLQLRPLRARDGREPALRRPDQHRQRPRQRPAPLPRRRRRTRRCGGGSSPTSPSWGNSASAALRALQSVVAHDRLDAEFDGREEQVAAAEEMLDGDGASTPRRIRPVTGAVRPRRDADREEESPWALSCRSTAARPSPTPPPSSASPAGSSRPRRPATTSSSPSRPWATPPTSCSTSPTQVSPLPPAA